MNFLVDDNHWERNESSINSMAYNDNSNRIRGSNHTNDETIVSSMRYHHSHLPSAHKKHSSLQSTPLCREFNKTFDIDDQKRLRTNLYGTRLLTHQHSHPPLLHQALISNLVNFQVTRDDGKLACSHTSLPPLSINQLSAGTTVNDYNRHGGSAREEVIMKLPLEYRRQHRPIFRAQRSLGNVRNGPIHGPPVQRSASSSAAEDLHKSSNRSWNLNRVELHKRLALADERCFSPVKWHHIYKDNEYVLNKGNYSFLFNFDLFNYNSKD